MKGCGPASVSKYKVSLMQSWAWVSTDMDTAMAKTRKKRCMRFLLPKLGFSCLVKQKLNRSVHFKTHSQRDRASALFMQMTLPPTLLGLTVDVVQNRLVLSRRPTIVSYILVTRGIDPAYPYSFGLLLCLFRPYLSTKAVLRASRRLKSRRYLQ